MKQQKRRKPQPEQQMRLHRIRNAGFLPKKS